MNTCAEFCWYQESRPLTFGEFSQGDSVDLIFVMTIIYWLEPANNAKSTKTMDGGSIWM